MPKPIKRPARKRPARAKPTRALARRLPAAVAKRATVIDATLDRRMGDDMNLGELGLVELKLTAKEEAVLNEPVNLDDVRIKPTGQPYLSHPTYTRWLIRAFGRGGWNLIPVSKPMRSGNSVVCPYVLYIHGKPAAFAMGEQEYFDSNRDQTYGDALEATVASGLRRCMKRLGVGLELWDRAWLDDYVRREGIRVKVRNRDGTMSYAWRRRRDAALPYEQSGGDDYGGEVRPAQRAEAPRRGPTGPRPAQEPAAPRADGELPISAPQAKRLDTIAINSGRGDREVDEWLLRRYGYKNRTEVKRKDYDYITRAIEASGPLPEGRR